LKHRPPVRLRFIVCGLLAACLYLECPFRLSVVWGQSMSPTIENGAICLLDRDYYQRHELRRGDIVAFRAGSEVLTKRVYGAPGDSITLLAFTDDGTYEIPIPASVPRLRTLARCCTWFRVVDIKLRTDQCFVIGDNADSSYDSRQFGSVAVSSVMGKVVGTVRR
jgi:signal peptidase I